MSKQEPGLEEVTALAKSWADGAQRMVRRNRRRGSFEKLVKTLLLMFLAPFVIIPTMIAGGFLLGPRGVEGILLAPLAVFMSWAATYYWYFGRKVKARAMARSDLPQLPSRVDDWLDEERAKLPQAAQKTVDSLTLSLEALTPQLATLDAATADAQKLKRLLSEELPELVRGYAKVPAALRQQPSHGGKTPERQLVEGLERIEQQLSHLHERLAAEDLRALATHERYLELKYPRKNEHDG